MRKLFTRDDLDKAGLSHGARNRAAERGDLIRLEPGVFLIGPEPPLAIDRARAVVLRNKGVASGPLAAVLHGMDGKNEEIRLRPPYATVPRHLRKHNVRVRYDDLPDSEICEVEGIRCTTPFRTLMDLAASVDDAAWEFALEWVLRNRHATLAQIRERINAMGAARTKGVTLMRRVLSIRPDNAPPTESYLETLMIQLIRTHVALPPPTRQFEVFNKWGDFADRPDLCWPELGVFVELDGQAHKGQPVYDSRRETAIVAAKGWFPARFTWYEVKLVPVPTLRRLVDVIEMRRQLLR